MPPSTGQKRNRQIPSNNSLITNFYQPQKKRQDTKISSNNENQVSFDQFKKEHLQSFKKRGLNESTGLKNNNNNNNKTNKKTTERQPLQQIGGLATNKNLNTGLKNKPGQEQRDAWCVYSDPSENDYGDDNSNDIAAATSQAPFVVFRDLNEQEYKNDNNDENKKGETDKEEQVPLRNTQRQEQTQENKDDNEGEPIEKNKINNDKVCAPLAPQKQNTFNFSDDNFSDEEDEHKGFFDDDEDDMLITTTKRPNMNALGTISRQQQQREEPQESDLVPEFSIPQFNIPVQSPVFDDPEPSDDDDDDCDKENEDTSLFPALPSSPTTTTSNTDENNSQSGSSIEKHDSKLDDNEKYNNIKQTTQTSSNITTTTTPIASHNSSSLDTKSISSIEATIPMEPTKQYETHVPYPLPRGKTLLEKFGIEKMSSDTSTSSSGSSTNQSLEVSFSKDQMVGDSSIRQLDEYARNSEDDGRLLPATVPMDPAEQQYEAHVPYAVPRGTSLLEKLGLQNNDDAETP
ncbi:hypothetical protein INT45_003731 [Circinella minor]|uniref:Uncharacterized protein n=1 Tax=Circinella minor TaxID=1195481 RepID=A0A8H7S8K2_9FUNG|nr:hypothetical protein INT45_003731 [Circinella minor]